MGVSSSRKIESPPKENKHAALIPESYSDKLYNCIVKIKINGMISTGFFMKIKKYNEMHFLITCFHCIPSNYFENKEIINILYGKKDKEKIKQIELDENKRFIKRDEERDIILIQILKSDNISDTKYLLPDLNYTNGYELYQNKNFYLAGYPSENNKERCISSGEIKMIDIKKYIFLHSLDTESGSSGSPICLKDGLFVIGIHNARIENNNLKIGTFVGIIIDELEINGINEIKDKQKENEEDICQNDKVLFTNFERLDNIYENNRSHYLILNKMTIIFNNKEYQKFMRILGDPFFKNNDDNIKIIVNDIELSELKPIIYTGFKREIIIILLEINTITDFSFMFYQCSSLVALPDISNWNMTNVENMSYMFAGCTDLKFFPNVLNWNTSNVTEIKGIFLGCSSLKFLPDISKWNISMVHNLECLFCKCSSLISLPDISKWDTSNVTNMGEIFNFCYSLKSLPDISKWDTSKVKNFSCIFKDCCSLISFPDISIWDTNNAIQMDGFFEKCTSLKELPDISKWELPNVETLFGFFFGCISLKSLPDISKWDISNVNDLKELFGECYSLISLPNISNWDTSNIIDMKGLFYKCSSLTSLPDISKWDVSNVKDMQEIFAECDSLTSLPDISKWNTSNVTNMNGMFNKCSSLKSLPNISVWDVKNLESLSYMFAECSSLKNISCISKWNLKKNVNMDGIFKGILCSEVTFETLEICNKVLCPDALEKQIYPGLIKYLFHNKGPVLMSFNK